MSSQLDRQLAQLALHRRRIHQAELSLRKYGKDIAEAKASLPEEEKQIQDALVQANETIAKIRDIAKKEAAQKGEVDRHVSKQAAQIEDAARNLAKQFREGQAYLSKHMTASIVGRKLAIHEFNHAVQQMNEGIYVATLQKKSDFSRFFIESLFRASKKMLGIPKIRKLAEPNKEKTPKPQLPTEHPSSKEVDAARKRIVKVNDARAKFKEQVTEHQGKLTKASEELKKRRDDAYRKIEQALKLRSQQLAQWTGRKEKLIKALKQQAERKEKIAAAEREVAKRKGILRGQKAQVSRAARYLRGARRR